MTQAHAKSAARAPQRSGHKARVTPHDGVDDHLFPMIVNTSISVSDGLYVATSPQFEEIVLASDNVVALQGEIPAAIMDVCKRRYRQDVLVLPSLTPGAFVQQLVTVWVVLFKRDPSVCGAE